MRPRQRDHDDDRNPRADGGHLPDSLNRLRRDRATSITATFKSASFLDFVYFTQLETLDPSTYGFTEGSDQLKGVNKQCALTYEEGRESCLTGAASTA